MFMRCNLFELCTLKFSAKGETFRRAPTSINDLPRRSQICESLAVPSYGCPLWTLLPSPPSCCSRDTCAEWQLKCTANLKLPRAPLRVPSIACLRLAMASAPPNKKIPDFPSGTFHYSQYINKSLVTFAQPNIYSPSGLMLRYCPAYSK